MAVYQTPPNTHKKNAVAYINAYTKKENGTGTTAIYEM
jgi:hypothetical protein